MSGWVSGMILFLGNAASAGCYGVKVTTIYIFSQFDRPATAATSFFMLFLWRENILFSSVDPGSESIGWPGKWALRAHSGSQDHRLSSARPANQGCQARVNQLIRKSGGCTRRLGARIAI